MLTTDYMAGYVLIDVGHGDVQRVVDRLLQNPSVHRAHALLGPNDIIAFIETDGWDTHRTRHAFEADRAKDAALSAAGYTVVRFTYRQLRNDPQTVADRIKAIIGARYSASAASASRKASSSGSSIE